MNSCSAGRSSPPKTPKKAPPLSKRSAHPTSRAASSPLLCSGSRVRGFDQFFGPGVVGFSARRPLDALDEMQLARHLVAGDTCAAVRVQLLKRRRRAVARLHDCRDALSPAFVARTDDERVEHRGM